MRATIIPLTFTIPAVLTFPCLTFKSNGRLMIQGRFISNDPFEYGYAALDWLERYLAAPAPSTELHISLEYLNGDSAKYMMHLLRILKPLTQNNGALNITWEIPAGDEDLKETVWLMAGLLDLDITIRSRRTA